jgi:hypothetical protein
MSDSLHVTFVVAEAGAAEFIEPVFGDWLRNAAPTWSWRVIAGPAAAWRFAATLPGTLPITVVPNTDVDVGGALVGSAALVASAGRLRMIETHALRAARRLGLPTLQFVDAWYGLRPRFERDGIFEMAERVLMIDNSSIEDAVGEGLPRERLVAAGHPGLERTALLPAATAGTVLMLGSPIREILGNSLGYDQHDCWRIVAEAAARRPDLFPTLLYAAHPEEKSVPDGVERIDTAAGLARCETVIGSFAAPMIAAYLGGRRVVSLQPSISTGDRFEPSRRGLVPRAADVEGLIAALAVPPRPADALRDSLRGSTARVNGQIEMTVAGRC